MLVKFASTYDEPLDAEAFYSFGIDLLKAGVEAAARAVTTLSYRHS